MEIARSGLVIAASTGPVETVVAIRDFAKHLEALFETFRTKPDPDNVTVNECDNVINIASNVVEAGGHQTINYVNNEGDFQPIYELDSKIASAISKHATETKAILKFPAAERKNAVAMTWKTFDKSPARTEGQRSPDKGIIEEIDPSPKAILFGDDETGLKADILASGENPMQMLYYVDVEIVRVDQKIKAYRIVQFSGKELLYDIE